MMTAGVDQEKAALDEASLMDIVGHTWGPDGRCGGGGQPAVFEIGGAVRFDSATKFLLELLSSGT